MINPDAAIEAVLLTYIPGDTAIDSIGADVAGRRAWARTASLLGGQTFDPSLAVPITGDFDMYVYSATPSTYGTPVILASSTGSGVGTDESISYTPGTGQDVIIVVKRVSGYGSFTLTSTGSPLRSLTVESAYGTAVPAAGVHQYSVGTVLSCAVTDSPVTSNEATRSSQIACTGWTGTHSVPASGTTTNTGTFTLMENSTITWNWAVSNLWVSNQVVTTTVSEEALDTITGSDSYRVESPGDVIFNAGEQVRLLPGFQASSGAVLRARITP
jgi:hypothetical protein